MDSRMMVLRNFALLLSTEIAGRNDNYLEGAKTIFIKSSGVVNITLM